jgi:pimeloyl-ACP methyl ester carboxylesterase
MNSADLEPIHGILSPGLKDHHFVARKAQELTLPGWEKYGIFLEYHANNWNEGTDLDPKLEDFNDHVDRLYDRHGKIVIIGDSAGASVALHAYAAQPDKISSVVTNAGKLHHPETLPAEDFEKNPTFEHSLMKLPRSLRVLRNLGLMPTILNVHGIWDGRVPVKDSILEGAPELTVPMFAHPLNILVALEFYRKPIARHIRTH